MIKLLLIEDDPAIIESLTTFLIQEGFSVQSVSGQREAVALLAQETFDIALIDKMLQNGNGYGCCEEAKKRELPVIFLTASDDENSVVKGLDMGADDYITKPFRPRELVSRIKSVLRRYAGVKQERLPGDLVVNQEKGTVMKQGQEINLSALEYRLLCVFLNNRGILLTRTKLLEDIWDIAGDYVNDNTLTVYIKRLREKVETDPAKPELIKTIRGMGYRMD